MRLSGGLCFETRRKSGAPQDEAENTSRRGEDRRDGASYSAASRRPASAGITARA